MLSKIEMIVVMAVFLGGGVYFFSTNPSYENSIQARVYYLLGNYDSAYSLAEKSLEQDRYNKMANTVLVQSAIAKEYEAYIKEGNEYFVRIKEISSKRDYSDADRVRVKMMCEIMRENFKELSPSTLTDKALQNSAKEMQNKFIKLHKQLF